MDITIEQLRLAVLLCTPGAPPSYADRLWQELEQTCECAAGGYVPHRRHDCDQEAAMKAQLYEPIPPGPAEARQWTAETDPAELAAWCDGWLYEGSQHGHTTPPWSPHTCLNVVEIAEGLPGKTHADPGDWIIRVRPAVPHGDGEWDTPAEYQILGPREFAAQYRPAGR